MKHLIKLNTIKSFFDSLFDPSKPKWVYISISLLLVIAICSNYLQKGADNNKAISNPEISDSADTYIPIGYVLVPLEISNSLTISNLMGEFTIVDVYTSTGLNERNKKIIAQNLRMVKAPHDENLFAVLVREIEHELIHSLSEPVFIVIKNPNTKNSELIKNEQPLELKSRPSKSRVTYGF